MFPGPIDLPQHSDFDTNMSVNLSFSIFPTAFDLCVKFYANIHQIVTKSIYLVVKTVLHYQQNYFRLHVKA